MRGLTLEVRRRAPHAALQVVRELTFQLWRGEIVGLVGESGSGKSMTARAVLNLLPPAAHRYSGEIHFDGTTLDRPDGQNWQTVRGSGIGWMIQESISSLHPTRTVGSQLVEAIRLHRPIGRRESRQRAIELLERVALPRPRERLRAFAHQLSGGERQRVALALALSAEPSLLVADEPTSSLDSTVQAQILDLLVRLRDETGLTILLITHDLAVVAERCDRALVLYAGSLLEAGPVPAILDQPRHPYTAALLATARFRGAAGGGGSLPVIPGQIPEPDRLPTGCLFHPRCAARLPGCELQRPPWIAVSAEEGYRCVLPAGPAEVGA